MTFLKYFLSKSARDNFCIGQSEDVFYVCFETSVVIDEDEYFLTGYNNHRLNTSGFKIETTISDNKLHFNYKSSFLDEKFFILKNKVLNFSNNITAEKTYISEDKNLIIKYQNTCFSIDLTKFSTISNNPVSFFYQDAISENYNDIILYMPKITFPKSNQLQFDQKVVENRKLSEIIDDSQIKLSITLKPLHKYKINFPTSIKIGGSITHNSEYVDLHYSIKDYSIPFQSRVIMNKKVDQDFFYRLPLFANLSESINKVQEISIFGEDEQNIRSETQKFSFILIFPEVECTVDHEDVQFKIAKEKYLWLSFLVDV
ncbi:hypothetical protein TVAG_420800 [Trichomonas vaginalis G3]|uniref:Uncharacterized protein n=1 Tax=Trichomonas vaginalis (strain ATCC PRA-98 / G3) TaxID=412133 RepID=A2G285_TRIV3|nr:uncharacterized protein TVAGG3_1071190 [Trichomonas vaginalis G3]EAX88733.1 hypothetical protein TVAG_420800 [Trichomonas vaginalis G3]KAI5483166.1 hypothetical protein TVAGG3_1071190 [Trichomonas vaginalis G3]|eukprot:XP_001301663.1 hypothetical protein [Trichomonas vaginalis G3]